MCYFLCLAISGTVSEVQRLLPPGLQAVETSNSPIGRATIGGRSDRRAYVIEQNGCSCDIFHKMRQEFTEVIDRVLRVQISTAVVLHWFKGAITEEEILVARKVRCSREEFNVRLPDIEEDVRYSVVEGVHHKQV